MLSSRGASSPSFIAAVAIVVVGVGGYGLWTFLRPSPHASSETVVREFARDAGREVSTLRRELRGIKAKGGGGNVEAALAAVDKEAEKAVEQLEARGDEARDELAELDIAIGTQRNRLQRIETREKEAKELITGLVEEAKGRLRGEE